MANTAPFPLMPSKSTELRLSHFDELVYSADSTTMLYKFLDAVCGDAGSGSLKKEIFLQRLSGAIENIYGSDLDYIFGNMRFLSRAPSESYVYDPMVDMLTSDQWDEVAIKDAWYRARIVEFFTAAGLGCQPDAIRHCVHAATSVDCEIFEVWRYIDNFGLTSPLGRSPVAARNEAVVKPLKAALDPREFRQLRDMLYRIMPVDTVLTIDVNGLSVSTPIKVQSVASDSTYFQVEKMVTATPLLDDIPAPELLAIDLIPTEEWLFRAKNPELAPYAYMNITSEYGYCYLVSGGNRSPIDSVQYDILDANGNLVPEANFEFFESTAVYTDWHEYEKADSPDNYPGGKYGMNPWLDEPLNPDGSVYQFPYSSQQAYITAKKAEVISLGGQASNTQYRMLVQKENQTKRVYTPDLGIAYSASAKDSTVSSSVTGRHSRRSGGELRSPSAFVRS